MNDKRNTVSAPVGALAWALILALAWSLFGCTPTQGRTARDIGAGVGTLACAVAGAAEGQPWAKAVAAIGCALARLLERRGTQEAAPVARRELDAALVLLEQAHELALASGSQADAVADEAALVAAERAAAVYFAGVSP